MITLSNLDGGCVCVERDNLQWKRMSKQMKKKMFQSRDSPLKSSNFLLGELQIGNVKQNNSDNRVVKRGRGKAD